MAQKAILNISNYSGGLNNHTNARDIEQNQFQDIDSFSIETPGKLKVMGAAKDEGTLLTILGSTSFTPTVGNGFFYFKSDKDPEQTTNAVDNTEMLFINDKDQHEIAIYDKTDGAYSAKTIDYGPAASDVEYTAIDGNVRVTATDFSNDNHTPKVFSFINEKYDFGDTTTSNGAPRVDKTGWFEDAAVIDKPSINEFEIIHKDNVRLDIIPDETDSGATLTSNFNTTGTITVSVSDGTKFTADEYIRINTGSNLEYLQVGTISGNNITFDATDRGKFTSGAFGGHTSGNAIYHLNRSPVNKEILRIPYGSITHTNNFGKLFINLFAGIENRSNSTIPNNSGDATSGTWFASAHDKINLFVQYEYLDGQLGEIEYYSSMKAPEGLGLETNYKMYFNLFGHIINKPRLKSIHVLWNKTNDGFNNIASDITSSMKIYDGVKYKLLEIDLRKGWRIPGSKTYQKLGVVTAPSTASQKFYAWPINLLGTGSGDLGYHIQYGASNNAKGLEDPLQSAVALEIEPSIVGATGTSYKTATVLNRRLYIGNVKYKDPVTGEFQISNDTVFKSDVNAFDTFQFDNRIDVEVNDGDDIIALESLNGRLMQFKSKTLYVVNVSRDIEFLEATLDYKGVERKHHVFKGEGFVAWFNQYGVFLYDGEQVRDLLLDNKGQKRLDWNQYYHVDSVIGFIPKEKHLVIVNKNQKVLVCDMKSLGWMFGSKRFSTNNHTNMVTLDNGKLVWMEKDGSDLRLRYFEPNPSNLLVATNTDELKFKTKDFTFGNPSIDKKIISVYVNYKNGDGVVLYGFTDGAEEIIARLEGDGETEFNTLRINMRQAKTEFVNPDAFNNVKNFGLRLDGTDVSKDFEINDIQVVFREKSVK